VFVVYPGGSVAGPLGLRHLPRLWLARLVTAAAPGSTPAPPSPDFDAALFDGLGIDRDAFDAEMRTLPTYVACERWVRAHLHDRAALVDVDVAIHDEEVLRDDLTQWESIHAWLFAHHGERLAPIVPSISGRSVGPRGIPHLARFWLKNLLEIVDALPAGWRAGPVRVVHDAAGKRTRIPVSGGLDVPMLHRFGVDVEACIAYLRDAFPSYPEFEDWFAGHAATFDGATLSEYKAFDPQTRQEKAELERAEAGLFDAPWLLASYTLNDLGDWTALHDTLVVREALTAE
jgi:hypothetical protein